MIDATSRMIILKGKPETLRVRQPLARGGNGVYWVTYISSPGKRYPHSASDVEFISNFESVDISDCLILRGDVILRDVKVLWLFRGIRERYWRIQYNDGSLREDIFSNLAIISNCLKDKLGFNIFSYLRNVANISNLRKEEADNSILLNYYDRAMKESFDETFRGTSVHEHRTPQAGSLCCIRLDFSQVSGCT